MSVTVPLYPVSLEKQQEETGGIPAGRNSLVWESKNEENRENLEKEVLLLEYPKGGI